VQQDALGGHARQVGGAEMTTLTNGSPCRTMAGRTRARICEPSGAPEPCRSVAELLPCGP
jgi:hypothetical protein